MTHNLVDTEIADSLIKVKSHECKMISSGLQLCLRSALKTIKPTPGFKVHVSSREEKQGNGQSCPF